MVPGELSPARRRGVRLGSNASSPSKIWPMRLPSGLARRIDIPAETLAQLLRATTPMELAMLLDRVLPLPSATGVEAACKWVLTQSAGELSRGSLARRNRPRAGLDAQR